MSKHTPGPWVQSGRAVLSTQKSHLTISRCVVSSVVDLNFSSEIDEKEADANARLIAAAPDLLEAARKTVTLFAYRGDDATDFADAVEKLLSEAIAKAEGRS